jgi:predicted amidohydrolase
MAGGLSARSEDLMSEPLRVAALQLRAHDRKDFPGTLDDIVRATRGAAATADLVVLPEGTLPAYVIGQTPINVGEIRRAVDVLCVIARETSPVIVIGIAAANDERTPSNCALAIDADGTLAGQADKLFLWHFDRRWFSAGNSVAPVPTAVGKLGLLVCADGRLPTIARALVDRGACLLVMPTAWVTSGRNPESLENVQADLLARVRAYENNAPFVAANKCGVELGMVAYCGKSQIVDANGEVLAVAGQRDAQTLRATLTLGTPRPHRATLASPRLRQCSATRSCRIAISYDPLPPDIDERLQMLDDDFAIAPNDDARFAAIDNAIGAAHVDDAAATDPGGCVPYRLARYPLLVWRSTLDAPWLERIARARALELRLYLIVFDDALGRAFAVDPDGTIVAGTFDGYRIASFVFDPRKTLETTVAPGTDVQAGLERIAAILQH